MLKKFIFFFSTSLLIVACAKHRQVPLDIQCDNDIQAAIKLTADTADKQMDENLARKIRSLIQAAKIQQQHADFASCIDKAQRALTLLNTRQEEKK
jgi:hypothetical protein